MLYYDYNYESQSNLDGKNTNTSDVHTHVSKLPIRDALLKTNREIAPRIVETIHNNIQETSKDWHDNQHIKKLDKIDNNYYIIYRSIEGT